jgi:signal transduction histidine kinase
VSVADGHSLRPGSLPPQPPRVGPAARRRVDCRFTFHPRVERLIRSRVEPVRSVRLYPVDMTWTPAGPLPEPEGRRERLADLVLAVAVAAVAVSSVVAEDPTVPEDLFPAPNAALVGLALLGSLPLAVRRRWPVAVHLILLAAVATIGALGWNTGLVAACLMFSLYTVAAWRPLPEAVAALVIQYTVTAGLGLLGAAYFADWTGQVATAGYAVVWLVGRYVRRGRRQRQLALARAVEAERGRAVAAERAVFAERLRIARELHDIVAHTLSVIAVQSGVARHLLGADAGPAGPALTAIEDASRSAMDDLRRMLGVLRADPADVEAALAPSPGIDELELLASAHRATHGPVALTVDPTVADLPHSLRLTAYRLVQEALTNVRKHAPGAPTRVDLRATAGDLEVRVDNDGPIQPPQGTERAPGGYGLAGMRERVAMFGGSLHAGPRRGGGFEVLAVLRGSSNRTPAA